MSQQEREKSMYGGIVVGSSPLPTDEATLESP